MIKRIVQLTFEPTKSDEFVRVFESSCEHIRAFEGCEHLELWQDEHQPNVFFTYSYWRDEKALDAYRHSELFTKTWAATKVLFNDRPRAWSVSVLHKLP